MRLWSLHPCYLDSVGLVALWREALLAQAVLRGKTTGYRHHPQLLRFRQHPQTLSAINAYLWHIWQEAKVRGYRFDRQKVRKPEKLPRLKVTTGQIKFEAGHLLAKLKNRDPEQHFALKKITNFKPHPLFSIKQGKVEGWEKGTSLTSTLSQGEREREQQTFEKN